MQLVRIQKDREIVFIAATCNNGGDLADADEGPLASEVPIKAGTSSWRAAAAMAFSPTRSETLK